MDEAPQPDPNHVIGNGALFRYLRAVVFGFLVVLVPTLLCTAPLSLAGGLLSYGLSIGVGGCVFLLACWRRRDTIRAHALWYLVVAPVLSVMAVLVGMVWLKPSGAEGGAQAAVVWSLLLVVSIPAAFAGVGVLRWLLSRSSAARCRN
jgi:hypothetical protein